MEWARSRAISRASDVLALALSLGASACGREGAPSATSAASGSAPSQTASAPRADEHGPPEPVALPAVDAICKSAPCSGPMSTIEVWRTSKAAVGVYYHHGDIQRCSHPPSVFFDAAGKQLDAIPMQPVEPGSAEAQRFQSIRERHTRDLTLAERVDCNGRVRPAR